MENCKFCRIVSGERDAYVLAETELTLAFLDANPACLGHTLIIPKPHCEFIFRDKSISENVCQTVQRLVKAMNRMLELDGVSIFHTTGHLTGNITHAHVHLIPRHADDDIHLTLERNELDHEEAEKLARRLHDQF